ncbi:MAG: MmgE/PrpD family protein [Desulfitobacteriaceae bacterium]|nr:MmgE/PrpD family protein [Desulfitobacteriaceae bacterium]MDD4752418.1 MmgE/PrpD family protein [Desulfitobacteriaceae bacterium]
MQTSTLSHFIANLSYDNLPEDIVDAAKSAYLDWLGSALAGSDKKPTAILKKIVKEMGGHPEATLIGDGFKTTAAHAALLNGASSHVVELDDVHKAAVLHAGAVVIPAALAVSEKKGKNGKDLITAIVAGYEIGIRVGEAVTPSHYLKWHTTGTCGTFGAAAAAAKALGLNEGQCISTLGSAGTQAAGLWEFIEDGAMSKHLHPGKAAFNGVLSALLAEKGYTAATRIIEGQRGFCAATAPEYNLNKITEGLGESFKIWENCYKIYSSCRHTHHVIDIIRGLKEKYRLIPDQVQKIKINTYSAALDITDNFDPSSVYGAKFSLPFCAALALVYGKAGLEEFSEANLFNSEIKRVMSQVELNIQPEMNQAYPKKWPASVEIVLTDGNIIRGQTDYPKGDPENPLSKDELIEKFTSLVQPYIFSEDIKQLVEMIFNMEEVEDLKLVLPRRLKNSLPAE